ncbi:MAG: hypothetical protein IK050_03015 [Lachnospiraceae bacterium]|nr:hypothetical protein [Lachnospiraceae bacterium]
MNDNDIKKAFEEIKLSEEKKALIWKEIEEAEESSKRAHGKSFKLLIAAMIAVCVIVSTVVTDMVTGGMVSEAAGNALVAVKEFLGISQDKQDVVSRIKAEASLGNEVYAPDIMYIDDERVLFGTRRGLILFDYLEEELLATIDLQAIDCFYFNTDNKTTHVLWDEGRIVIYNVENGEPIGSYHVFEEGDDKTWSEVLEGEEKESLKDFEVKWQNMWDTHIGTFAYFSDKAVYGGAVNKDGEQDLMYSELSIEWTDVDGNDCISYLYVDEATGNYKIFTYYPESEGFAETAIILPEVGTEEDEIILPEFIYTGDDAAIAAICDYMGVKVSDMYYDADEHAIRIPAYVIYGEIERDGKLYVFGNFVEMFYVLNGNILECVSGGNYQARFTLTEVSNGYEVIAADFAEEAGDYEESLKRLTEGFDGMYDAFFDTASGREDAARMEFLKMYVALTNADIRYYKDFGWDPVEIK